MTASTPLLELDWPVSPVANDNVEAQQRCVVLEADLQALEPMIGAAVLVTTAFRLRDDDGLVASLRHLTDAVEAWETRNRQD
ncbi:MAG: hypothetical protein U1E45_18795 [Geminicoccaceae bacterium]